MIELKNITMKFNGKIIFNNFNYTFNDNNIYTIQGESGKGKTTLLKIISGLLLPSNGNVLLNNKIYNKPSNEICMMHQHYSNFPWKNCLENILFPIKVNRKITE
jgi:NitT/TauT family transport system ATP-binding protein